MQRLHAYLLIMIMVWLIIPAAGLAEDTTEKNEMISFGGQVRLRYDVINHQSLADFSYAPGERESQLLNRTRLYIDANPAEWVRLYFEPQFYGRLGGYDNEDRLSVYQGYVDFPRFAGLPLNVRVGRQDFVYGSAFFLGNDDWYEGLTWDGAKMSFQPFSTLAVDLIAARLVSFTSNKAEKPALYGFYSSYSGFTDTAWDFYFFYNRHGFKHLYSHLHESQKWFTAGTRFAMKFWERISFELEPMYQFGSIRNPESGSSDQIRAYGGHIDVGYDFDLPFKPSITLSYAFGTGDSNDNDNTFREFHGNVYNDTLLVGDISQVPDVSGIDIGDVRASGMKVFSIMSSIKLNPALSLNLDWHHFTADKTPRGFTKTVGSEADLYLEYALSEKINITASVNRFFTAKLFREATGKSDDVDYFYLQTQFEF